MGDWQIRNAIVDDIGAMVELLRQLFTIEADFDFQESRQRQGLEMLIAREGTLCLVAEGYGRVIGMGTAQTLISTAAGGKKALVEDIVVTAEFRGRGVGRAILEDIERWAARQGILRLDLLADRNNVNALDFYARLGWKKTDLVGMQKRMK